MNDRWRDTYDAWKLRSPYDEQWEAWVDEYGPAPTVQCEMCGFVFDDGSEVLECYCPECPMVA